ncbi:MAG: tRNA(5-methylaminomethyl-2-thiouridylate) methyltransferase [Desulfovibrio sp.]|jgi:tRNA U34 2-thiouridine synthase MnmA/TrmU|nr:tRNA(5-methylaminomethyl-2-thiouridylate) methyltransferase [Desulfovibrio sp.]
MLDKRKHKAVVLLSGGLDSLLSAKIMQEEQGLEVLCLHFVSPFFGKPHLLEHWRAVHGLDIRPVDIGEEFAELLAARPLHGYGSVMNPCVDCKILMLRRAAGVMRETGACCIVTGEVLGQRPMSQRRDTLNIIRRDADLKGLLLRPLCARHLEPTRAEEDGLVDREKLYGFSGRSRKNQRELAARFGIEEIPSPAGGCKLTEQETARSCWAVLKYTTQARAADFYLVAAGRQLWHLPVEEGESALRLIVGRNEKDNAALQRLAGPRDLLFSTADLPGPTALGRFSGREWPAGAVNAAASLTASYSGRAVRRFQESGRKTAVLMRAGNEEVLLSAAPVRDTAPAFAEYTWNDAREDIRSSRTCGA